MHEKNKLPVKLKRPGGLHKKQKRERAAQTTVFHYERGIESTSLTRSKSER
jgi:hypothetical protein